jgi:choline monooxygenase
MTYLARPSELALAQSPLTVSAYHDQSLFDAELAQLFAPRPHYVGHSLRLPQVGDYLTLSNENDGRSLIRQPQGIELLSNVCRHRQAIMLKGSGNLSESSGKIVCPLHRWTYEADGRLIGAPHFPDNPCKALSKTPLIDWQGLLFDAKRGQHDLNELEAASAAFDFTGYAYSHSVVHECAYNWKTFIEVYLEDYHVEPFHPGLGQFVDCEHLQWQYGREYSLQTVGVQGSLARPGSAIYQRWHQALTTYRVANGLPAKPDFGALWLTLYPNLMVERYPEVLVVSQLIPRGPQHTTNLIEFYYPEDIVHFEPAFIAAEQAAYMETCEEDDEIALRMDAGRKALLLRGETDSGPYQSPMEDGMQHFHQWYTEALQHV